MKIVRLFLIAGLVALAVAACKKEATNTTITVSMSSVEFGPNETTKKYEIAISSPADYYAVDCPEEWVIYDETSNPFTIMVERYTYAMAEKNEFMPREATITISAAGMTPAKIRVKQTSVSSYTFTPETAKFTFDENTHTLQIPFTTNAPANRMAVQANKETPWIYVANIEDGSGEFAGKKVIRVQVNDFGILKSKSNEQDRRSFVRVLEMSPYSGTYNELYSFDVIQYPYDMFDIEGIWETASNTRAINNQGIVEMDVYPPGSTLSMPSAGQNLKDVMLQIVYDKTYHVFKFQYIHVNAGYGDYTMGTARLHKDVGLVLRTRVNPEDPTKPEISFTHGERWPLKTVKNRDNVDCYLVNWVDARADNWLGNSGIWSKENIEIGRKFPLEWTPHATSPKITFPCDPQLYDFLEGVSGRLTYGFAIVKTEREPSETTDVYRDVINIGDIVLTRYALLPQSN